MNKTIQRVGMIIGGVLGLVIVTVLVIGVLPTPVDAAPVPATGHTGAPKEAPTVRPVDGTPQTWRVKAGEKIQAAVDKAKAGDLIEIEYGTYQEAVKVKTHNLTLRGVPNDKGDYPILEGNNKDDNGVFSTASFLTVEKLKIQNYRDNGVIVQGTYGPIFRDLVVDNTGRYAVFPIASTNVLIERVKARGISDSALYVGQSREIIVRNNEAYESVTGIEIENSVDALVENNYIHDNTGGILVFLMPNLNAKEGHRNTVRNNRVENNNLKNFATQGIVQQVPQGIGILVLAADGTEVTGNTISGNVSVGVAVVAHTIFFKKSEITKFDVPLVPEQTWVHDNKYKDNGLKPADFLVKAKLPGVDILWDVSGWDNRFDESGVKIFPPLLPNSTMPDVLKRAWWQTLQFIK